MNNRIEMANSKDPSRSLWNGETFVHWLFLGMASVVILMSILMSTDGETKVFLPGFESPIPSVCSSKVLFGVDCPGCGLTRAFIAISHGEFWQAWQFNRAGWIVYAFVALQIPWHAIQLYRRGRGLRPLESNLVYLVPIGMVVALLINWLIKLVSLLA